MRPPRLLLLLISAGLFAACSESTDPMRLTGRVRSGADASAVQGAKVVLRAGYYYRESGLFGQESSGFRTTASSSQTSSSSGGFDVTVEPRSDDGHDFARLTVDAPGYWPYSEDLPFADRKDFIVVMRAK